MIHCELTSWCNGLAIALLKIAVGPMRPARVESQSHSNWYSYQFPTHQGFEIRSGRIVINRSDLYEPINIGEDIGPIELDWVLHTDVRAQGRMIVAETYEQIDGPACTPGKIHIPFSEQYIDYSRNKEV